MIGRRGADLYVYANVSAAARRLVSRVLASMSGSATGKSGGAGLGAEAAVLDKAVELLESEQHDADAELLKMLQQAKQENAGGTGSQARAKGRRSS